jgi:membrane-associated protease RseP (regulator of RpoE activity)
LSPDASLDQPLPPYRSGDANPYYVPAPPRTRDRVWLHVILLAFTVLTTTLVGALHHFSFSVGFNSNAVVAPDFRAAAFYLSGLWYSGTILAILGCHEMGHYVACRYYHVDASLPFFLPAPLPLTGTLGAFIRIRSRIPSRVALFDIGLAGPIAGFIIAVPALFIGLALSSIEQLPENFQGVELGEPLLFRAAAWLIWGDVADGMTINMHPMAFAAWFGLLATALNLFPIGQLDGGHVAYSVLGRRSTFITLIMIVGAVGLTAFVSTSWLVWTILMVVMLFAIGPHHPPTLDDQVPLGTARLALAVFALIMLIVCFTPAPIEPFVMGQ